MASSVAIKAIDAGTVHRIQSGQVIVDLCSVAKELVENAIDAGATSIDVRFKNQGLDSIEVQDNGAGISPQNYETLALKHYTSKLSTYADLTTLQTFGFRGEALSSLCALSSFSVVTCMQEEAPKAKKLQFESSGKLTSTSVVSGQKGTTVFVEGLFHNLPVRRRELGRNIKREWGKVVNLLNQYACVLTRVKFSVSQQPTKGKRMVMFSTKGNPTTRDNIINVFGVKTMNALITLELKLELIPTTTGPVRKQTPQSDRDAKEIFVRGHVSRPAHGEGRQTPDRQMFYVNGRPCGLPQFAKVFNEVYRSYNVAQSPFIFADIQLDTHLYDVNVSPDKRTILLHDQGQMLDNLKEALVELFEKQDVTVPVSQLSTSKTPFKKPTVPRSATPASDKGKRPRQSSTFSSPSIQTDANLGGDLPQSNQTEADDQEEEGVNEEENDESEDDSGDGGGHERQPLSNVLKKRPVPSKAKSRDVQASNLMTRWVERGSNNRVVPKPAVISPEDNSNGEGAFGEKGRLLSKFGKDNNSTRGDLGGSEADEEDDSDRPKGEAVSIKHFSALPAHSRGESAEEPEVDGSKESEEDSNSERHESPIPAIPPPTQQRPNPLPITTSPRRPSQQVATIRIGDDTVTSLIGPPAKRLRAHVPPATVSSRTKKAASGPSTPLPSFRGRLTQMFAATNSTQDPDLGHSELAATDESDREESLFVSQDDDQDMASGEVEDAERETSPPESDEHVDSDVEQSLVQDADIDDEPIDDATKDAPSSLASEESDEEYVDEKEQDLKKVQDDSNLQTSDMAGEAVPSEPTEETQKRSQMFLKGRAKRKDTTLQLMQRLKCSEQRIQEQMQERENRLAAALPPEVVADEESDNLEADNAEEKLSLKISKSDFGKMKIVGQFNLGFVLAVREAEEPAQGEEAQPPQDDELFIIDQHASDEKYNFERLQASTVVQSQRLVQPKTLELTALEEEVIMENVSSLESNGFNVKIDDSGDAPVGSRIQLLSLPLSRETTFSLADLEELIFLLGDNPTSSATTVPRPSKVRKMFAMRACRSSIMVGKALSHRQMEKVVRNMGGMEKPWNCPHGRPTMRHLCGLGAWEERGWREGDGFDDEGGETDWAGWLKEKSTTM